MSLHSLKSSLRRKGRSYVCGMRFDVVVGCDTV